jgi:hypothetical protein
MLEEALPDMPKPSAARVCRVVLSMALLVAMASPARPAGEPKLKKPRLDVKATPRMAFSPVNIFLTAELVGGDEIEEYYCPELEWDFDDGGKSIHEADCPPYDAKTSKIERRFTAEHEYRRAGSYNVRVTVRQGRKNLAVANVRVTVRPGLGDRTPDPGF